MEKLDQKISDLKHQVAALENLQSKCLFIMAAIENLRNQIHFLNSKKTWKVYYAVETDFYGRPITSKI
jgi:hypothetical protein